MKQSIRVKAIVQTIQRGVAMAAASMIVGVAHAAPLEIIVPAYFYPVFSGSAWDSLTTFVANGTPITAIMNPGSGPGTAVNSDYTTAINNFRAAGGKVLGYVPTGYAGASVNAGSTCQPATGTTYAVSDVVACAQRYQTFYNVDGIFLDEFTNTTGMVELDFYRQIYQGLKGTSGINPAWRIMGNPGTSVPYEYLDPSQLTADTIVSFEGTQASYTNYAPAPGAVTGAASQFAHLVYDVSDFATAQAFLERAGSLNVGSIFITDDNFCRGAQPCAVGDPSYDGNPWDTLPNYFKGVNSVVRTINAADPGQVPLPAPLGLLLAGCALVSLKLRRR
jgi:Spherulation-specific family 4